MKGIKRSLKEKIAILRLKQGDTEAFGFLYDTYSEQIFRYIYFRVSERGLAYDLMQDVFLSTWEYITNDKEIANLQSFIYRVAYYKVVDHYRTSDRQPVLLTDVDERKVAGKMDDSEIELHFIKQNIKELKPEYQDVLLLKHVEGFSAKQIAEIMEKDINNVRVTLHRAMNALKALYEKKEKSEQ